MVRLNDRPYMTLDVYHGRKTTIQQEWSPLIWNAKNDGVVSLESIAIHHKVEYQDVE